MLWAFSSGAMIGFGIGLCNTTFLVAAQNAVPSPVRMTQRAAESSAARQTAASSSVMRARLSALRLSARVSVNTAAGERCS